MLKGDTKFGGLTAYRIRHWLPVLPGSLTIVPSTIRIGALIALQAGTLHSPQAIRYTKNAAIPRCLRRRFSRATSETFAQFSRLAFTVVSRNE